TVEARSRKVSRKVSRQKTARGSITGTAGAPAARTGPPAARSLRGTRGPLPQVAGAAQGALDLGQVGRRDHPVVPDPAGLGQQAPLEQAPQLPDGHAVAAAQGAERVLIIAGKHRTLPLHSRTESTITHAPRRAKSIKLNLKRFESQRFWRG